MKTYKRTKVHVPKPWTPEPVLGYSYKDAKVEYKASTELEQKWNKKLRRRINRQGYFLTPADAGKLLGRMCDEMGVKRYPRLHVYRDLGGTSYCARGRDIVIAYHSHLTVRVLLHELAHFIVSEEGLKGWSRTSNSHDADFLWVLDMLYQCYEKEVV